MTPLDHAGKLADLLRGIQPYLDDVVLVGGWVQALYIQEADLTVEPVRTTDIDLSLPRVLPRRDRPNLLQLIEQAGYEINAIGGEPGLTLIRMEETHLDLLCDADSPLEIIRVEGQDDLAVQGYPHLAMQREASRRVMLGRDVHESLDPPIPVRFPTLPTYSLGRVLSALNRERPRRKAKDLVYLYQVIRERQLHDRLNAELPEHVLRHPAATRTAAEALGRLPNQRALLRDAGRQIRELGLAPEPADPVVDLRVRLRRLKNDLDALLRS